MVRRYLITLTAVLALIAAFAVGASAQTFFPFAAWFDVTLPPPPCATVERAMPVSHLGDAHVYYHCIDGSTKVRVFKGSPVPPPSGEVSAIFPPVLYAR